MTEALTQITADIVSAFVSNNSVRPEDLAALLRDVHGKLVELATGKGEPPADAKPEPPVPIKKTITAAFLVSLEDGRRYKTLRRHLATKGLTPDQYRAKWGLPADYPMVCKDYAERRSALARSAGLGRRSGQAEGGAPGASADGPAEAEAAPAKAERTAKKPGRKAGPHPKPKDRAKAKPASAEDDS